MTRLMHNVITVHLEIKKNMPTNMGWVLSLQTKEEVDLTQDWGKKRCPKRDEIGWNGQMWRKRK